MHQALHIRVCTDIRKYILPSLTEVGFAVRYGWDLHQMSKRWNFDIYDSIRAVNWMRREVAKNRPDLGDKELIQILRAPFEASERPAFLSDDSYLQPYLPDDALLPALSCESWNEDRENGGDSMKCDQASGAGPNAVTGNGNTAAGSEVESLRAENQLLREKLERQEALIEAVLAPFSFRAPFLSHAREAFPIVFRRAATNDCVNRPRCRSLRARRPSSLATVRNFRDRHFSLIPTVAAASRSPPRIAFHTEAARPTPRRAVQSQMQQRHAPRDALERGPRPCSAGFLRRAGTSAARCHQASASPVPLHCISPQ